MTSKAPNWKHDCTKCRFLGQTIGGGRLTDLYVCRSTLIARFSDDGPDYYSCPVGMARAEGHAELFIAQTLSQTRD